MSRCGSPPFGPRAFAAFFLMTPAAIIGAAHARPLCTDGWQVGVTSASTYTQDWHIHARGDNECGYTGGGIIGPSQLWSGCGADGNMASWAITILRVGRVGDADSPIVEGTYPSVSAFIPEKLSPNLGPPANCDADYSCPDGDPEDPDNDWGGSDENCAWTAEAEDLYVIIGERGQHSDDRAAEWNLDPDGDPWTWVELLVFDTDGDATGAATRDVFITGFPLDGVSLSPLLLDGGEPPDWDEVLAFLDGLAPVSPQHQASVPNFRYEGPLRTDFRELAP